MEKKIVTLTKEQFEIYRTCKVNPFYLANFVYIIHPVKGKVQFKLYEYQRAVLWNFLNNRFNIILKFRQAGLTELIAFFCLWLAMFNDNKNIQIISIKDMVAKRVLKRIKYMYKNLPEWLQTPVTQIRGDSFGTATVLEFVNGSSITSVPTTEEAGRSEAVSLLVIDEAAIVRWADRIWAAAFPTLSTGGSAILNSTPMGIGNFFHKQWVDAKNGDSYFNPIRLYWQMHPERNEEWYNSMAKSLGPRRTAQEIDGDFLSSGNTVFDLNCIRAIEECLPYPDDYISIEQNGKLFIRRFAKPGERCFIGADVAIGRANDYSAFSVMNRYGEELAYFRGKINPSKYANLLMHTGKRFNNALIAPESNDIGLAVTSKIQDHGYPNLYYAKKLLKKKGKSKPEVEDIPGWYTTTSTRPIIIDELEEDIRFDQVNICNKFFVDESYTFIFDSRNRPVAMGKDKANDDNIYDDDAVYTDDCIMAEAITNYIRKGKKNLVTNPI